MNKIILIMICLQFWVLNLSAEELTYINGEQNIHYLVSEKLFFKKSIVKGVLSDNSGIESQLSYSKGSNFTDLTGFISIDKPDFKSRKLNKKGRELPSGAIDAARDKEVRALFKTPVIISFDGLDEGFDLSAKNNKLTVLLSINKIQSEVVATNVQIKQSLTPEGKGLITVMGELPIRRSTYKLIFKGFSSIMNSRVGEIITMKFKMSYRIKSSD